MNAALRKLLDQTATEAPRSKLEPYADVIRELRQKRKTYRAIAAFFQEHLGVAVTPSTIHFFVKRRARTAAADILQLPPKPALETRPALPTHQATRLSTQDAAAAREHIRAIRKQPVAQEQESPRAYHYDDEKPLVLDFKSKEK